MGIFDRFENAVEKGFNSVFSKVFRSGLKPVDISSALHRVMDDSAETPRYAGSLLNGKSGKDKDASPMSPNAFTVLVSPTDYKSFDADGLDEISGELAKDAVDYAAKQRYTLAGPVTVDFEISEQESTGILEVLAEVNQGTAAPATGAAPSPDHPIIDIDGDKWLLTEDVTVIGRSSSADITVEDSGISRKHVEFRITPNGVILTDLDSTNGTFVEGNRIQAATLLDGNQITIGRTRITFWTHPEE